MDPYLLRLHSALNEWRVPAPCPTGTDTSPDAAKTVQALADTWKAARLKELGYTNKADAALRKALAEELRVNTVHDASVRAEIALGVLNAYTHVSTLLEAGDISLAARVAALIDENDYKARLLELYNALNAL